MPKQQPEAAFHKPLGMVAHPYSTCRVFGDNHENTKKIPAEMAQTLPYKMASCAASIVLRCRTQINSLGGFNLRFGIKCFIVLVMVATTSFCASASDTTTKFQTGPFIVSIDLGESCSDLNISEPVQKERLTGDSYTNYDVKLCGVSLFFVQNAESGLDVSSPFGTAIANDLLIQTGADKDTIKVFERQINSLPGAVGSGYIPKLEGTFYVADFYISSRSTGHIYVWDNETKMISALKTIHVTEVA